MTWTPARTKRLKELWAEGDSASAIARQLGGITRNAVISKARRLGLPERDRIECRRAAGRAQARARRRSKAGGTRTKAKEAKPKKQKGSADPPEPSPEELEARREATREAEAGHQATMAERLEAAAVGALCLPLVTVRKGPVVKWRNRAKHPYKPRHYIVTGLGESRCHFPTNDGDPFTFCGKPAAPGSAYCWEHHSICYQVSARGKSIVKRDST